MTLVFNDNRTLLISNDKILFQGILLSKDTYLTLSFKEEVLTFQCGKYLTDEGKGSNLWWYNFDVFYKKTKSGITVKGNVEMQGLNNLSINKDWKESKYVVFFIERNYRFSGGCIWISVPPK